MKAKRYTRKAVAALEADLARDLDATLSEPCFRAELAHEAAEAALAQSERRVAAE